MVNDPFKGSCFHPKVLDNRELGDLFGRKTCQQEAGGENCVVRNSISLQLAGCFWGDQTEGDEIGRAGSTNV